MDGEFVRQVPALGHLYRVHVPEEFGHGDVRGRQLLTISIFPGQPLDGGIVAVLCDHIDPGTADRGARIVIDL